MKMVECYIFGDYDPKLTMITEDHRKISKIFLIRKISIFINTERLRKIILVDIPGLKYCILLEEV